MGLLVSFGYFLMYAWSYFYGDLYTQKRQFEVQYFVERMWLASILLMFSIFQCYLFIAVLKCSLYLNSIRKEKLRRSSQFEEVSNRVRLAKENGLWRSTSWGGGFQEVEGAMLHCSLSCVFSIAVSSIAIRHETVMRPNLRKAFSGTCRTISKNPSRAALIVFQVKVQTRSTSIQERPVLGKYRWQAHVHTLSFSYTGHLHHPAPAGAEHVDPGVKEAEPQEKRRRFSTDAQAVADQPSSPGKKARKHRAEKHKRRNSRGTDGERHASDSPVALQKAGAAFSVHSPGTSQTAASCYVNHAVPVAGSSVSPRTKSSHRHAGATLEHTSGIGESSKTPTKGYKDGYEGTSGHRKSTPHDSSSSPVHVREASSKSSSGESPPTRRGSRSQPVQHPIVKKVFISSTAPTSFQSAIL
ncbi:Protein F20D6.10 [Aphelenchoides avenae]|nr:Protein F20D6.10 [Aphelenchus avenae]